MTYKPSQKETLLTAEMVREILNYDPETGVFTWRKSIGGRSSPSAIAGRICQDGWRDIGINGPKYAAHRLAWIYMTGEWPSLYIDHINGDRLDNRFSNLRVVDNTVNIQNQRKANKRNSVGLLGVTTYKGRFIAQIGVNKKQIRLGCFSTPEEAHAAYLDAKRRLHPGCTI